MRLFAASFDLIFISSAHNASEVVMNSAIYKCDQLSRLLIYVVTRNQPMFNTQSSQDLALLRDFL